PSGWLLNAGPAGGLRPGGGLGLFAGLAGHDGGVEPVECILWVGRLVAERVDQHVPAVVVVDVHVLFVALDQRQGVAFTPHRDTSPSTRVRSEGLAVTPWYRPVKGVRFAPAR